MAGRKANSNIKLSPKLVELCKSPLIDAVNAMLDAGESPASVCKYINSQGFKISNPLVYEYKKIRQQCIVNNINIEHLIGVVRKPVQVEKTPSFDDKKKKLKSELDALDKLIQMGYDGIDQIYANKPVPPALMMSAIQLKNNLTEGSHGFLTNYGLEQLKEIEKNKYEILIDLIMSYVPEDKKEEVLQRMEQTEDEYYQQTEYYVEYLKAKGLSEEEINKRIYELEQEELEQDVDETGEEPTVIKL